MKLPKTTLEKSILAQGCDLVCGVDEVGMGCLAGPIVVCAVSFTPEFYTDKRLGRTLLSGLKESKLLTATQREKFSNKLLKLKTMTYAIAISSSDRIDEVNIYQASREAMRSAIREVNECRLLSLQKTLSEDPSREFRTVVLVDGNKKIKDLEFEQHAIVKGDQKIFAIACASVIAKVHRDNLMKQYAKQFPAYGFEQHKGYSTKQHQESLKKNGSVSIHRRSFRLEY